MAKDKKIMQKEELQYNKMINTPVKKLVLTLGIPTTISMLITSIYNIADTLVKIEQGMPLAILKPGTYLQYLHLCCII